MRNALVFWCPAVWMFWNHGIPSALADKNCSELPGQFNPRTNSRVKMRLLIFASLDRLSVDFGRIKFRELPTSFSENIFVSSIEMLLVGSGIPAEGSGWRRIAGVGVSFVLYVYSTLFPCICSSSWGLTGDSMSRGEKVIRLLLWRSCFCYTSNASCVGSDCISISAILACSILLMVIGST